MLTVTNAGFTAFVQAAWNHNAGCLTKKRGRVDELAALPSCYGGKIISRRFEKLGVPTVALYTLPFARRAESMAKRRGFPDYRYVLVEHPLSSARPEGIRQRAEQALPEVLSILLGHAADSLDAPAPRTTTAV
jgi:hypothetical protein